MNGKSKSLVSAFKRFARALGATFVRAKTFGSESMEARRPNPAPPATIDAHPDIDD
jgi:hypothetical protein